MRNFCFTLILAVCLLSSAAQAENPAAVTYVTTKYFTIKGPQGMDILKLLQALNYDYFLRVESLVGKGLENPSQVLGSTADALLMETAKVLGIHLYSFHADMEFIPDRNVLKVVLRKFTGADVHERAFYLHEEKTIFISLEDAAVGVVAHEMAHALICHHFGAPPAENIQEILAGYVDFSLTKRLRAASR